MNALSELRKSGFDVSLNEQNGIVISPASKLTQQQREFIKANKPEIVSNLKDYRRTETPQAIQEQIEERAAIMEFDGGLSRTEAEKEAASAIRIYNYKVTDKPDSILTSIMPNTDLEEAERILRRQYGQRLLMVIERKVNTAALAKQIKGA